MNQFNKQLKLSKSDLDKIQTTLITGCLGGLLSILLSFFGFHIFMNEFVRELNWQKTLLIWISLLTLVTRIKGS